MVGMAPYALREILIIKNRTFPSNTILFSEFW